MTIASIENWVILFIGLGLMQASPGPAVFTLVGYSFEFGRSLAVSLFAAFVMGQFTALLLGVLGLAMVLSRAPEVIDALRFAGGCLLLYVGLAALIRKRVQSIQSDSTLLKMTECFPMLTAEEEKHYTGLAQEGDEDARIKMLESNLWLLAKFCRYYTNRGLTPLELIKESYLALNLSIDKFDPEGGIRFPVYTAWRIRQTLECALLTQPRAIVRRAKKNSTAENPIIGWRRQSGWRNRPKSISAFLGPNVEPPSHDSFDQNDNKVDSVWRLHDDNSLLQVNNWLMELEPRHRNILAVQFGLHDNVGTARKKLDHTSTITVRARRHAVTNTWFIAASSPIAIVFYTAVFPDFVDVTGLNANSFLVLGTAVFIISVFTSAFYILASCFTRKVLVTSSIGRWISSLANMVLILAGVWVLTAVVG